MQRDTGTTVAIKTPNSAPTAGATALGVDVQSLREIKFMQELSHRNIVQLLDVFKSRDKAKINLVMEYLECGELRGGINDRSQHLGAAHVKGYIWMILDGIAFLHDNWILHRDMKPENLLLAADGTCKIADFGLARGYGDRANSH
eukprot:SAG31_NODE_22881_length_516_cov_0.769784_1_plen_144_part_01